MPSPYSTPSVSSVDDDRTPPLVVGSGNENEGPDELALLGEHAWFAA